MNALRTLTAALLATSLCACDAADEGTVDDPVAGSVQLTLLLPTLRDQLTPQLHPWALAAAADLDIRRRIESPPPPPDNTRRAQLERIPELTFRDAHQARAQLPAAAAPGEPAMETPSAQDPDPAGAPELVFLPADPGHHAALEICAKDCVAAGASFTGRMISINEDARCVCFADRAPPAGYDCTPLKVELDWADSAGAIQLSEDRAGYRCD